MLVQYFICTYLHFCIMLKYDIMLIIDSDFVFINQNNTRGEF